MGYSEVYCHICGVSFNIGRIRTQNEPRWKAWDSGSRLCGIDGSYPLSFVSAVRHEDCTTEGGCKVVYREDARAYRALVNRNRNWNEDFRKQGHVVWENYLQELRAMDEEDERLQDAGEIDWSPSNGEDEMARAECDESIDYEFEEPPESCDYEAEEDIEMDVNHVQDLDSNIADVDTEKSASDVDYRVFCDGILSVQKLWADQFPEIERTLERDRQEWSVAEHLLPAYRKADSFIRRPEDEYVLPLHRKPNKDGSTEGISPQSNSNSIDCSSIHLGEESVSKAFVPSHHNHRFTLPIDRRDIDDFGEHIAGPGCVQTNGYSGHRITFEEMQHCNTLQCLVPKTAKEKGKAKDNCDTQSWENEDEDEAWEQHADYFLSGLSDYMPSRDMDSPNLWPARHGRKEVNAENVLWDVDGEREYGMPFHPTCLEVYKRACERKLGTNKTWSEIEALANWWWLTSEEYDHFHGEMPRCEEVKRAQEQMWEHVVGDEWLAADPCFVPGLRTAFESTVKVDANTKVASSGFPNDKDTIDMVDMMVATTSLMPPMAFRSPNKFHNLPYEVQRLIFDYLSTFEMATFADTVPSSKSILQPLLRARLVHERPYLWELWSNTPYSRWTYTTSNELKARQLMFEKEETEVSRMIKVLVDDGWDDPAKEMENWWRENRERRKKEIRGKAWEEKDAVGVEGKEVDYARLVLEIERGFDRNGMKGLRNRERIWQDCARILNRIENLRIAGTISEDGKILVEPSRRERTPSPTLSELDTDIDEDYGAWDDEL